LLWQIKKKQGASDDQMIEFAKEWQKKSPKMAQAYTLAAGVLAGRGDFAGGLKLLDAEKEKFGLDPFFGSWRVLMLGRTGRTEDALALAKRLVEEHPKDDQSWSALGAAFLFSKDYARALAASERVLKISPKDTDALSQVAALAHALGQEDRSKEAFRILKAVSPKKAAEIEPSLKN
jgi:tetratricopeptide (TPR) repeat protein